MSIATELENGIVCSCGSTGWDVLHTQKRRGYILRRRECRRCRQRTTTIEKRVGDAPPSLTATCSGLVKTSIAQLQETLNLMSHSAGGLDALPKNFGHATSDQPR
jgi:hypothetical protein